MRSVRSLLLCVTFAHATIALQAQQPSTEMIVPADSSLHAPAIPPPSLAPTPFNIEDAIRRRYQVHLPNGKVNAVRLVSVGAVFFRSTAADVGLQPGDLLFAIDGVPVTSAEELQLFFSNKKQYNAMVRFDLFRAGQVRQAIGPVFTTDYGMWKPKVTPHWGGDYKTEPVEFSPDLLNKPVIRTVNALEITAVRPDTAAAEAGLQKGDTLITMNGYFMGKMAGSNILMPPGREGSPVRFVYLRDHAILHSEGKLTQVRIGLRKILVVGLSGTTKIVELPNAEAPAPLQIGAE